MAHVRLGKTTKSIVEFLIFDDNDKQCGSIYFYTKFWDENAYHQNINDVPDYTINREVIGKIPTDIEEQLEKLENIVTKELKNNQ